MPAMTDQQRIDFRRELSAAVVGVQNANMKYGPDVVITELTAALMSLSAFILHGNIKLTRRDFFTLCKEIADQEWPEKGNGHAT